ncbi:MAG: hypothetical protein K2J47_00965 [Ruminococcus sp.]|nr:hypothetical protein [Ruminococcus sp.]
MPEINKNKKLDANMAAMMYYQIDRIFGAGSQLLTMEYPGRTLNRLDFAYPIEDYNSSSLSKPYAVAEKEFRLCDNMLDLSPIVQGPNGSNLSVVYNTAINNYTPKLDNVKDFVTDKMELRLFLMEKITDEIDGEQMTCSRMEFCQRTYLRYLEKKYKWDQEKIDKQKEYTTKDELDEYAKWLATTAWTKDHELECLFNDAVVRGFYHEIMTILGFLDVASPAERLSSAKTNRRTSTRRSLDDSMDILPVQFQPSNWFRSLMPNFSPQDLTLGTDYLTLEYQSKKALLTSLEAELRTLVSNNIDSETIERLESETSALKDAMISDEKSYYSAFTDAQVKAIKLAFEIASKGDMVGFISGGSQAVQSALSNVTSNVDFASILGVDTKNSGSNDIITDLIKCTYDLYDKHLNYFKSFDKLMDMQLALTSAQSNDYQDQIEILKEKIRLLKQELNQLAVVLTSNAVNNPYVSVVQKAKSQVKASTDAEEDEDNIESLNEGINVLGGDGDGETDTDINMNILPTSKYDEDTTFTDIVFSSSDIQTLSQEDQNSTYSKLDGSMGNLFFNSSSNIEYSASSSEFVQDMYSEGFTIGMRVTKVTIDRGGWFDPSIFELSSSFMRLNPKILTGAGLTVNQILEAYNNKDNKYERGNYTEIQKLITTSDGGRNILPAFPSSFIIVKDVVIKSTMKSFNKEHYNQFRNITANTTSHIFGFRMSGGYTTQSYMGYNNGSDGTVNFYMRIPGPQILGWFMELTAKDNASKYESLSKSNYFTDIMAALKDYREKLNGLTLEQGEKNCIVETIKIPK